MMETFLALTNAGMAVTSQTKATAILYAASGGFKELKPSRDCSDRDAETLRNLPLLDTRGVESASEEPAPPATNKGLEVDPQMGEPRP
jgi:hypothetical protein